jgi:hypothetical protein
MFNVPFLAAEPTVPFHIEGLVGALRRAGAAALTPEGGFTHGSCWVHPDHPTIGPSLTGRVS